MQLGGMSMEVVNVKGSRSRGGVMENYNNNNNNPTHHTPPPPPSSPSPSPSPSSDSCSSYTGGWVYHIGVNKLGNEFCNLRYLLIRSNFVELYKRDPHHHPHIKPIRRGVVSYGLMLQDLGRRTLNRGDLYVLRFYNRLDESKKGQIACATAGEVNKWIQAFEFAKHQVPLQLSTAPTFNIQDEINLGGHRHTVRRYAHDLRKLIKIGQGPEPLLLQSSALPDNVRRDRHLEADADVIEAHTWKCVRTMSGIRIFEDVAESKVGNSVLVKSVGMIEASADVVFEVLSSLDRSARYEWDMLTGDLELIETIDGHYDVVYGTYDPKYLSWWSSKRDFVFSRQWFCGQDGTYTILQLPAIHKKRPPKSGYRRTKINPSSWEIKSLVSSTSTESPRCLLTHMLEMKYDTWCKWKRNRSSDFEKSVPFALLCQVAGIKEYVGANPALAYHSGTTIMESKSSDVSASSSEELDDAVAEEFYDAIAAESSKDEEDSDDEVEIVNKGHVKLKNVAWAIAGLSLKRTSPSDADRELVSTISPVPIDPSQFHSTLLEGKDENDKNCWRNPGGMGFMIRGKTYLKDHAKVRGGDPLLKLVGVDCLKSDHCLDKVALRPSCIVQSEAGRKLPFILVLNLQIPAKPNYSMVFYFAADRPVSKDSLLSKFIDGSDMFRDSRFKLIPSIVEGYWMVKRAVGSKACLLGKAVTCRYLRQYNFLEIDVDIGSSSVARSVIGLVLGYVTGLVVDLAVVIEAQEENELPEYLLGTVRLNCVRLDSAVEP